VGGPWGDWGFLPVGAEKNIEYTLADSFSYVD